MQSILQWDRDILRHINAVWHNSFLDWLLPFLRNSDFWTPLYFFMILFATINYKKSGWYWVVFAIITATLSNFISSDLIKENIHRLRPCNDPSLADWIRILPGLHLPQSSSFTSSHAANHFAIGTFFYCTLKKEIGKWAGLFFIWAAIICYAQMYVGVHYLTDIIFGAIVGLCVGYATGSLFNRKVGLKVADTVSEDEWVDKEISID